MYCVQLENMYSIA